MRWLLLGLLLLVGCSTQAPELNPEGYSVLGSPDAPVTFVEFSDYDCPFCKKFTTEVLPLIMEEYVDTGKVRFIYHDFTLSAHRGANMAAVAADCAGEQGQYFPFHDFLFERNRNHSTENYLLWADELGLDVKVYAKCISNPAMLDAVRNDVKIAKNHGAIGTPTLLVITAN